MCLRHETPSHHVHPAVSGLRRPGILRDMEVPRTSCSAGWGLLVAHPNRKSGQGFRQDVWHVCFVLGRRSRRELTSSGCTRWSCQQRLEETGGASCASSERVALLFVSTRITGFAAASHNRKRPESAVASRIVNLDRFRIHCNWLRYGRLSCRETQPIAVTRVALAGHGATTRSPPCRGISKKRRVTPLRCHCSGGARAWASGPGDIASPSQAETI